MNLASFKIFKSSIENKHLMTIQVDISNFGYLKFLIVSNSKDIISSHSVFIEYDCWSTRVKLLKTIFSSLINPFVKYLKSHLNQLNYNDFKIHR